MGIKAVIIKDISFRQENGLKALETISGFLEKDLGVEVVHVEDHPEITTPEDFNKMVLAMETGGPDAFPVNMDMVEVMKDADFAISHFGVINSEAINNAKKLSAVCLLRSGVENVNVPNATARGVKVVNVPGRLAIPVSEFTVGLIISEMRNIARSQERLQKGEFPKDFPNAGFNHCVSGSNVGIIGFGAIGQRVAAVVKVMGAQVLVFDPYAEEKDIIEKGYKFVSLNELFMQSDIVSLHYRLTEETRGLIGKEQFDLMKPHAFFINTARAGLVDEKALIDTLVNHRIGGAGIDVFHQEPLPPDHPFLKLDNVTTTSHIAGSCTDTLKISCGLMEDVIRHYFKTGIWKNAVN